MPQRPASSRTPPPSNLEERWLRRSTPPLPVFNPPGGYRIGTAAVDPAPANNTATQRTTVIGLGTIIITNVTDRPNAETLSFTAPGLTPSSFALAPGTSQTLTNVAPGTYAVTASSRGSLQVSCNDGDSLAISRTGMAFVQVAQLEVVECTFGNDGGRAGAPAFSAAPFVVGAPSIVGNAVAPEARPVIPLPAVSDRPTAAVDTPAAPDLAFTGASSGLLAQLGALLIVAGSFATAGSRRRLRRTR